MVAEAFGLPPGVERVGGHLVRRLTVHENGEDREVTRPVALTLRQAQKNGWDFYHPELGWIRGGIKPEREHPIPESERFIAAPALYDGLDDGDEEGEDDDDNAYTWAGE